MGLEVFRRVALADNDRRLDFGPSMEPKAQYPIQGSVTPQAYHGILRLRLAWLGSRVVPDWESVTQKAGVAASVIRKPPTSF